MEIKGLNFIGNELSGSGKNIFSAVNPGNSEILNPVFHESTGEEIEKAVKKAEKAFEIYRKKSGRDKARFLEAIAEEITSLGDDLIKRCVLETGLPETRLTGERGRTVNQLKLFAEILKEGSWVDARIETANPERQPLPKPDIRSMKIPLGPVAVFGASNFPLAFSVAGGDTASALAAGCPVLFKAHYAHPGTCEMVACAIINAVKKTNMPDGTFSLLHGYSNDAGISLVEHPIIKAVGFTGSFNGGKAIYDAAVRRKEPIPVYAEMGSTNPVFILPGALLERKDEITQGLAASVTMGVGQFCTNPGLVFFQDSKDSQDFISLTQKCFKDISPGVMLTEAIQNSYLHGITVMKNNSSINLIAEGKAGERNSLGIAHMFHTTVEHFLSNKNFEKEIFGPCTLTVTASDKSELLQAARSLSGHLTTTVHGNEEDLTDYSELLEILQDKSGRLIIDGYPTGVEVCHSMVHGGPYPATTDSRTTSVGTMAIERFIRPIAYQNFPDNLLPDELKNSNPLGIWRMVNGERVK